MSEPFISPIKIRLKELLVIFPCVHPVVIGGLSQWLFVGSSCVSDSSPLDEKDVWPTNASEKIKTRVPLKNHTPHDCHFSMSPFLLQGCFLPYHFVVLCSLLDIKFTRCFHFYEAVWSVIWSEHKDVVRSGLEPELWGKGFCISKCLHCHQVWKFNTFINLTYLPACRHKRRLSQLHENDCRHSTARSTV